jgi:hypothetical protein
VDIVIAQELPIVRTAVRCFARIREIVFLLVSWTYELTRRDLVHPQGVYTLFCINVDALSDAFSLFGVN